MLSLDIWTINCLIENTWAKKIFVTFKYEKSAIHGIEGKVKLTILFVLLLFESLKLCWWDSFTLQRKPRPFYRQTLFLYNLIQPSVHSYITKLIGAKHLRKNTTFPSGRKKDIQNCWQNYALFKRERIAHLITHAHII